MSATRLRQQAVSLASPLLLAMSVVLIVLGRGLEPDDLQCAQSMSWWSPAFEAVEYEWKTFQNGFSQKSVYRGPPNAERERAWADSLQQHPVSISQSKMASSCGADDGCVVNGTSAQVPAYLEVFRNLACLNLLRQHTYRQDYDYTSMEAFQGSEERVMRPVDGCLQRLREVLMCSGDATPYLIMRTPEKRQKESPDFNTLHYCRDFDRILRWTRAREVHGPRIKGFRLYE